MQGKKLLTAEQLNEKVTRDRIASNRKTLLKASKRHFPESVLPQKTDDGIELVRKRVNKITYCFPTTKTKKGLGVFYLTYSLDDVWISSDGKLVVHIDVSKNTDYGQLDRYGNLLERKGVA